ncbi:MAG: class IV adenylate cyclase [Nitrososphaera sp.]|nr:class IV adenylate cyclase [Nitrososphaera sp.]
MRKEIEVKARVNNLDFLESKLRELGCQFSSPIRQDDKLFYNYEGDYATQHMGLNILRIRKQDDIFLFTIKQSQTNELDCIEYETEIKDPKALEQALLLMGYRQAVELHKIRRKTKYNDLEICLDQVEKLGNYVEVEKLAEDAEAEKIQGELFDFLMTLSVKAEDREMRGYDTLMWLKENK